MTKLYVPCPHCSLPIKGTASGVELEEHRIAFDAEVLSEQDVEDGAPVVTVNPYVPSKYDADSTDDFAFPTITLFRLLGDRTTDYFDAESVAQLAIEQSWPEVRRFFEYYLAENWAMYDRVGPRIFDDWQPVTTVHERTTNASQALRHFAVRLTGYAGIEGESYLRRFHLKHLAAIRESTYMRFLWSDRDEGRIATLQRALFDLIELFVSRFETWQVGRLTRWLEDPTSLDELTLFRDEFPESRDLYQQAFELISKTLRYPIASQNTVKRGDPNDFGDVHPPLNEVPIRRRPTSIKSFEELPNALKAAYLRMVPGWETAASLLDNRTRNTIGHASVRHDLRSGRVVTNVDTIGIGYLSFLAKVFDSFQMLTVSIEVLRSVRIASSPDFRIAQLLNPQERNDI